MNAPFGGLRRIGRAALHLALAAALGGLLGFVAYPSVAVARVSASRDGARLPWLPFTPLASVFLIQGLAMEPTLQSGQIVPMVGYWGGEPQRGDIVVFDYVQQPGIMFVRRIIGMPGDTVEIRGGTVFVNGEPLAEPYIAHRPSYVMPKLEVPPGRYLVLGDNRSSHDNPMGLPPELRFLPRENIIGRVTK